MRELKRAQNAWLAGARMLSAAENGHNGAAGYFASAVSLDPGMADGWLGMHATGQQQEQAVIEMARNESRYGEERDRTSLRLWSRFDVGVYVSHGLETYGEMWCSVAALHALRGEYELAASAIVHCPTDLLPAVLLRGKLAFQSARPDEAIQLLRQVIGKDDFLEIEALLLSAAALAEVGAMVPAREYLNRVLRQTLLPKAYGEAHQFLGLIARAERDEDTARAEFQLAYAENPGLPGLLEQLQQANAARVTFTREGGTDSGTTTGAEAPPEDEPETVAQLLEELDRQIGQDGIKSQVRALLAQTRAQLARKEAGLEQSRLTEHFVFTGPPGTGKTTIARTIARLYKALGILESDQVVEVDRSGLIGQYHGQTVARTREVLDQAMGGVLFIDEAYALQTEGFTDGDPFGREAIDTILKRMEDDRDKLVIIAAGYPEPMQRFLGSNPGLKSRFTTTIDFRSYSADELGQIAVVMAEASGNVLTGHARAAVTAVLGELAAQGELDQPTFGNARYVRNLVEKAARQRDHRLFADEHAAPPARETLVQLVASDIHGAARELG